MKDVGIREFRDHASSYLSAGEPLVVRKHGKVVGFYLPVKRRSGEEEVRSALRELSESLEELKRDTGLSEEDLVRELVGGEEAGCEDG
jgi:antitoxin (DNA-binding transcriptional repressor) of toxin-antitoxin stability system